MDGDVSIRHARGSSELLLRDVREDSVEGGHLSRIRVRVRRNVSISSMTGTTTSTGLVICAFSTKMSRTLTHLLDIAFQRLTESAAPSVRFVADLSSTF